MSNKKLAAQLKTTIKSKYWDEASGLFADTPDKQKYSQHANSLAILADIVDDPTKQAIGAKLLSNEDLAPASIYFKYYLHLALNAAGYGDDYLDWLDIWRKNIDLGLTTWGETSQVETTRSDCHAWGASPIYLLGKYFLGVKPVNPGYTTYQVKPQLGGLQWMEGTVPTPNGQINIYCSSKEIKVRADEGIGTLYINSVNKPKTNTGQIVHLGGDNYTLELRPNTNYLIKYKAL